MFCSILRLYEGLLYASVGIGWISFGQIMLDKVEFNAKFG